MEGAQHLSEMVIMAGLTRADTRRSEGVHIIGISEDSRSIEPGYCFVAIRGTNSDGHNFIADALRRGAVALVIEKGRRLPASVPAEITVIETHDTRRALGKLSHAFYGNPGRECTVIGVTGTNAKTSTTYLLEALLKAAGRKPGVIGTVNYRCGEYMERAKTTTPSASELARLIRVMRKREDMDHVIIEVSSHAIAQHRIEGLGFQLGIYTNLTRDHLDYHRTMEEYRETKWRFFRDYVASEPGSTAIFNIDDATGLDFYHRYKGKKISFGIKNREAQIVAKEWTTDLKGTRVKANVFGRLADFSTRLIGEFNIYNILGSISAGWTLGLSMDEMIRGVEAIRGIPGRLEKIECGQPFTALVDYSHTPDALEKALVSLTRLKRGKIITVFGCGGDRDKEKRPMMGKVVSRYSDYIIITSDNPRSEDALRIARDAEQGIIRERFPSERYTIILDRKEAIYHAIQLAQENDIVLVAGKGHEDYQIVGHEVLRFDDREVVREAVIERESTPSSF